MNGEIDNASAEVASGTLSITAIILTFNEEIHIARCIERIRPLVARVVVVDCFSTDATVGIARSLGAELLQHPFKNHAAQFQWALDTCHPETEWVLKLDADEYLEEGASAELRHTLRTLPSNVTGYEVIIKIATQLGFKPPTIMLASVPESEAERMYSAVDRILNKPVDIDLLLCEMGHLLDTRVCKSR